MKFDAQAKFTDQVMDVIRTEAERCDSLSGFEFVGGVATGTELCLTRLLLIEISERYPGQILSTNSLIP